MEIGKLAKWELKQIKKEEKERQKTEREKNKRFLKMKPYLEKGICPHCGHHLNKNEYDVKPVMDFRGYYWFLDCPVCGSYNGNNDNRKEDDKALKKLDKEFPGVRYD